MTASRANAFGDLSEFQPRPVPSRRTGQDKPSADIDRLAQESGFPSRQPQTTSGLASRPSARRHTTGRNQQINVKATPETIARFYRLADERKVVLGELLEIALEALEQGTPAP